MLLHLSCESRLSFASVDTRPVNKEVKFRGPVSPRDETQLGFGVINDAGTVKVQATGHSGESGRQRNEV